MKQRLGLLEQHGFKINDIQEVIATLEPLPGAIEFVDWMRERFQVIILSDTFYEFSQPLMRQLHWPTLFCHRLVTDDSRAGCGLQVAPGRSQASLGAGAAQPQLPRARRG